MRDTGGEGNKDGAGPELHRIGPRPARPAFWRSLGELSGELGEEEPGEDEPPDEGLDRREFLRLASLSLAASGVAACTRQPTRQIAPYVRQPEAITPGVPLSFATAMTLGGYASGLLVTSREGRPIKIEGNPMHPASLGATDLFAQASILTLYDPDRAAAPTLRGQIAPWSAFLAAAQAARAAQLTRRGAGLRVLTGTVTSPTLLQQLRELLAELPLARWHQWDPAQSDAAVLGAQQALGGRFEVLYDLAAADRVLSLDADFLACGPASLRHLRDFARRRRPDAGERPMLRLYMAQCTATPTGAKADHRLRLRPSELPPLAAALGRALGVDVPAPPTAHGDWIAEVARDLLAHRGASLVIPGDHQPAGVHALAHHMNHALGAVGRTVRYIDPVAPGPAPQLDSLAELTRDMAAGRVEALLIVETNPVYTAPPDLRFSEHLRRVPLRIHASAYADETSRRCDWHLPLAHYLESWSDARAFDGTATIVQPLIAPLHQARTAHEILAAFSGAPEREGYDLVRGCWRAQAQAPDFETFWRQALEAGVVTGTAFPARTPTLRPPAPPAPPPSLAAGALEVTFRPDPTVHDGRFAMNAWLQEKPKPLSKVAWDNVATVSPATAERLGLSLRFGKRGRAMRVDVVELQLGGRAVRAPIWIEPGQPDGCVALTLGYGRDYGDLVGAGAGYDAYALRSSSELWAGAGLALRRTGQQHELACAQTHHMTYGRDLVRAATLDEYRRDPKALRREEPPRHSLFTEWRYPGHAWGMAIDLNACVGCGACVIACQAENNIPAVGKAQAARGRDLHWLRIDAYHRGPPDDPETYFQPVPCMHCERAPCEVVCPTAATVHSAEGLNDQNYARCIGTRYCSNNCPYKVRRFNFFRYAEFWDPPLRQLLANPEVTVRSRGVMEKCTYCVQRIDNGRMAAQKAGRPIRDGEIVTACAAACPAEAIVFGDINDPGSRVSRLKALPRNYGMLEELNTQPRTTYLAAVRNPNPAMPAGPARKGG